MAGEITHSWNGSILTITSDSGTSSCDLLGPQGDDGVRGPQGIPGNDADVIELENEVESVSNRVAQAETDIDNLQAGVNTLETASTAQQADIDNLESAVNAHNSNMDNPHGVSVEQIGAVSIDDKNKFYAPTYPATDYYATNYPDVWGTTTYYGAENRIGFKLYKDGAGYEGYRTPTHSNTTANNIWYNILTTKSPVTLAQGGTGATTAQKALANLAQWDTTPRRVHLTIHSLEEMGITADVTTEELFLAMPTNSSISFGYNGGSSQYKITDLPFTYGTFHFTKGFSDNYGMCFAVDYYANFYYYKRANHSTAATEKNGWYKVEGTKVE